MSEVSKEKECNVDDIIDDWLYLIIEEDEDVKDVRTGQNKARLYLGFELKKEMKERDEEREAEQQQQNLTARVRRSQNRLTKEEKRARRNRKQ